MAAMKRLARPTTAADAAAILELFEAAGLHPNSEPQALNWKYWRPRGVVMGMGHTWFDLMRSPVDQAVDILTGQDYAGNPQPVMMIDEYG